MRKSFPYPLPIHALDAFRHPAEWHGLHHARRHGDEVLAGNGYVALRVRKGMWLDSDHEPASAEFLGRFGKLPWGKFDGLLDDWTAFDRESARIFRFAEIGFWLNQAPAPSPVWHVNSAVFVRLSLLQLVAKLPRCECYTGPQDARDPLFFRFSGGIGIVARDPKLTLSSAELFGPERDLWSGERIERRKGPKPRFSQPGVNWPPVDMSDA